MNDIGAITMAIGISLAASSLADAWEKSARVEALSAGAVACLEQGYPPERCGVELTRIPAIDDATTED